MPSSAMGSVIIAAASAVMKTALIGAAGFLAVKRPKNSPLLPIESVNMLSRMSFVLFSLPLIYTGIAANISLDQLQSLWFMIVAATVVISSSYIVATILGSRFFSCFGMHSSPDFDALRISATFPNTLAIPILVFPTLCEYEVVYTSFGNSSSTTLDTSMNNNININRDTLIQQCKQTSNGMVFAYFFAWSLLFWSVGNQLLIQAGTKRQEYQQQSAVSTVEEEKDEENDIDTPPTTTNNNNLNSTEHTRTSPEPPLRKRIFIRIKGFILPIISSSGFIVMILGFVTACIRPLQTALFKPGGVLRFIGSALESLGNAATSLTCIVVAASLAVVHSSNSQTTTATEATTSTRLPTTTKTTTTTSTEDAAMEPSKNDKEEDDKEEEKDKDKYIYEEDSNNHFHTTIQPHTRFSASLIGNDLELPITPQPPPTSTNNIKKQRYVSSSIQHFGSSIRRRSTVFFTSIQRNPTLRMHIWYNLSRLILSPAIACGILIALDCGGLLSSFPPIGKLVILVNAAVPGGLIVVVILKAKGLSESASIVARIYLPSYLLSIVTIAGWTAVGLMISIPNGKSYCSAR